VSKAFLTLAVGEHEEYLSIALPSYEAFADRHGYDLYRIDPVDSPRPPSWWKIPGILRALESYDDVLFVGADFVCVDPTDDLDVPAGAWQALVAHETGDGLVPNADLWYLRQPMMPYLAEVWGKWEYTQHGWWEQAALLNVMGYAERPARIVEETELYQHTHFLDPGWNVHRWDMRTPTTPRFRHATMWPDRARIMREWALEAAA
jgi:hypothetical protein